MSNTTSLPDDTVEVRFRLAEHLAKQYQIPVHDTGINHAQHILSLLESAGLIRSESGDVPFPKGETVAMVLSAYERQCRHDRIDGIGTQPWPFVERIQKMFVTEQSEDRCAFSRELPPPGGLVCGGDKSQPEHNPHDPRFDHFYAPPLAEQAEDRKPSPASHANIRIRGGKDGVLIEEYDERGTLQTFTFASPEEAKKFSGDLLDAVDAATGEWPGGDRCYTQGAFGVRRSDWP